jgi:amphi-Trp domain-containing protein
MIMPEEILFKTEQASTRAEAAAYLRALADKLDADGTVHLSGGPDALDMTIPERFEFEVKAERETSKSGGTPELSLELEFEWKEGVETEAGGGTLEIT